MRVDIDTIRDVKAVPKTLELLNKHDVKASFFVTTGIDESYKNYRHYLNPKRLLATTWMHRYGLDAFAGLISRIEVQSSKELLQILQCGHELGLHGYNHFEWMNGLEGLSEEAVTAWISRGCELFEKAFNTPPSCFAAPGFNVSQAFLSALDGFGFRYSSDFQGLEPFYPQLNGERMQTPQVPVSLAIGEHDDSTALELLKAQIDAGYAVFYFHPSYEPVFRPGLLERAFELVAGNAAPLGRMAP